MPKYYRFRATTPTRKVRQTKDNKGAEQRKTETLERATEEFLGLTIVCAAPPWYRRRTAWREGPANIGNWNMGSLRPLATVAGRPVFIVKLRSPDYAI